MCYSIIILKKLIKIIEKENIDFDKNLEDSYTFDINLNKDCGGIFGRVYFATMTRINGSKEIPIVLKTFKIHHNDIKGENIMVDLNNGIIKLIDLGCSILKNKQKSPKPLNKYDEIGYKSLQSAFYKLLDLDNKEKIQVSML